MESTEAQTRMDAARQRGATAAVTSDDDNGVFTPKFGATSAGEDETPPASRGPSIKLPRKKRRRRRREVVEETTEETLFEAAVLVDRVQGSVVCNGPVVILDSTASADVLFMKLAERLRMSKEELEDAFGEVRDEDGDSGTKLIKNALARAFKDAPRPAATSPPAGLDNPGFVTTDGAPRPNPSASAGGRFDAVIEMEDKDGKADADDKDDDEGVEVCEDDLDEDVGKPMVQVEMKRVQDQDGVKIHVRMMKRTVKRKIEKTLDDGGHVMAKACTMTVICAVFLIVAWIVLDQAEIKWFAVSG